MHQKPIRHDFRRSAVKNLGRAGVSREVAKQITGHKTDSVFNRYRIVSKAEIEEAARSIGLVTKMLPDSSEFSGARQKNTFRISSACLAARIC